MMKEQEARKLVSKTFSNPYKEETFRLFIDNLFHDYERCDGRASNGQYIREAFRPGIVSFKRLAKFKDPEDMAVDVLAVKVASAKTLENARTLQRNFIAWYLNGSRGNQMKEAALVAFYADDCDDWRFSLVKMDYAFDAEKQKIYRDLTPARRYSFLVGRSEITHTACSQIERVLHNDNETTLVGPP